MSTTQPSEQLQELFAISLYCVEQTLDKENKKEKSAWERVELSRSPARCTAGDYIDQIFEDFTELHGDRCFGDDGAVIGGIAPPEQQNRITGSFSFVACSNACVIRSPTTYPMLLIRNLASHTPITTITTAASAQIEIPICFNNPLKLNLSPFG